MLIGNLGRDAELKYTNSGLAVATINIATTEIWNDKHGQKQEKTEWHRAILWDKQAENLAQYLVKGKQVYVEGRIQTKKWTDKNQIERYSTEIRVDRIVLLGGGKAENTNSAKSDPKPIPMGPEHDSASTPTPDEDDIPFSFILPFVLPLTGMLAAGLSVWA